MSAAGWERLSLVERGIATGTSLCLPFPLRPNFSAQVVVPIDMTTEEAARLSGFLMLLVQPKQGQP